MPPAPPIHETRFLLIRHAQSTWNAAGRWQGLGDPPLSDEGRAQAERLAQELVAEAPEVLVASDLVRAVETARTLARGLGLDLELAPGLRELDIGSWTGLTRSEIAQRDGDLLRRFDAGDPDARPGGGESRREQRARVRDALGGIAAAHPARRVAVVTHLGVIRCVLGGSDPGNAQWRDLGVEMLKALE